MACMAVVDGLETEPDPRYGRISARFRFEDRPGSTVRLSFLVGFFYALRGRQRPFEWPGLPYSHVGKRLYLGKGLSPVYI